MAFKKRVPYIFVVLIMLIFIAAFVVCSLSVSGDLVNDILIMTGKKVVTLSSGTYSPNTESLTTVLQSGETAALNEFTALRQADFSGSECYDEIFAWAQQHPEVSVKYTVTLPDGKTVPGDVTSLDLSGIRREDVQPTLEAMKYLTAVSSIDLGTSAQSSSPLTADDVAVFTSACPWANVSYAVDLLGRQLPLSTDELDLSGITSSQVGGITNALALLPAVNSIKLSSNATTDGSLTWDDVTAISQAAPGAAIDYNFSVCGVTATMADTSLDLTSLSPADVDSVLAVLPGMSRLSHINLGDGNNGLTLDDVDRIASACPSASIDYSTSVYGVNVNLSDEYIDLSHKDISDEGAAIRKLLPHMKNCTGLDMDSCGVSDEAMAVIRDENPSVNVVWRVWFGSNYSCRTDVVKILASKPSKGGSLSNGNTRSLQYCTKVRYLDLGHAEDLTDFSFISHMPDLQIAVISMAGISDLSPFASCSELTYLEMGNTRVGDLSPLASCTKLRHLNIGTNSRISDISPLYDIPLRRLWIGVGDPVPSSQVEEYRSRHPECEVNTTCPTGLENNQNEGYVLENWKSYQRYLTYDWDYYARYGYFPDQRPIGYFKVIYRAFEYDLKDSAYSFSWNDPLYDGYTDGEEPAHMKVVDISILDQEWYDHDILEPIWPDDESYG